jgi:hypothetical protein
MGAGRKPDSLSLQRTFSSDAAWARCRDNCVVIKRSPLLASRIFCSSVLYPRIKPSISSDAQAIA